MLVRDYSIDSLRQLIAKVPRSALRRAILSLPNEHAQALLYDWEGLWARPKQLPPPGDWTTWLIRSGRGFGKTRTGAETTNMWARNPEECGGFIALVGRTAADVRDTMIEGESGILAVSPPWFRPHYEPSKRRLTWPNGVRAIAYSGDKPDQLRGPQHGKAWGDEIAHWRYAKEAAANLDMGLRLGTRPQRIYTSTPKPTTYIRKLLKKKRLVQTVGSSYENRANLTPEFFEKLVEDYEGSRLGRQEIYGEVLEDNPGALWTFDTIARNRVDRCPTLTTIVIAVDPATTTGENSDETGIIVAGLGDDGHVYILEDATGKHTPAEWAGIVVRLYLKWHANFVVAERNQGGQLVERNLRVEMESIPVVTVHAKHGKRTRGEPVATLDEQGRVHHVGIGFEELEDQMCMVDPDEAAKNDALYDRADARTYAVTYLQVEGGGGESLLDALAATA